MGAAAGAGAGTAAGAGAELPTASDRAAVSAAGASVPSSPAPATVGMVVPVLTACLAAWRSIRSALRSIRRALAAAIRSRTSVPLACTEARSSCRWISFLAASACSAGEVPSPPACVAAAPPASELPAEAPAGIASWPEADCGETGAPLAAESDFAVVSSASGSGGGRDGSYFTASTSFS